MPYQFLMHMRMHQKLIRKTLPAGVQSAREGLLFADQIVLPKGVASQREATYLMRGDLPHGRYP
jgi:hypothetical protein